MGNWGYSSSFLDLGAKPIIIIIIIIIIMCSPSFYFPFSMQSMSYQGKGYEFFPELLVAGARRCDVPQRETKCVFGSRKLRISANSAQT
jgi:hypothetical protein